MPAIAPIVADLLAQPRPVICLDTCDLLDVIQCVTEGKASRLEHVQRLIDELTKRPMTVSVIITYLVPIELAQNQASVVAEVEHKIKTVDEGIAEIHLASNHIGTPLKSTPAKYASGGLPAALVALVDRLLGLSTVIDRDDVCINRALERVETKTRPSHAGMVKDSIHLEHYLELSWQLHAAGFPARRAFVSANKADFCVGKTTSTIHTALAPQLAAVGLEFFGSLEAAMGSLGI